MANKGIDIADLSLKEIQQKIIDYGSGATGSKNTPIYENYKIQVQLRIAEVLKDELESTRKEGSKASFRLLWLNFVLASATLVMAIHAGIQIYRLLAPA